MLKRCCTSTLWGDRNFRYISIAFIQASPVLLSWICSSVLNLSYVRMLEQPNLVDLFIHSFTPTWLIHLGTMEDTEQDKNCALGYDFEDKETRSQMELIDDLQKLGLSEYLDLPHARSLPPDIRMRYLQCLACCCWRSKHWQKLCSPSRDRNSFLCKWQHVHTLRNGNCTQENIAKYADPDRHLYHSRFWWEHWTKRITTGVASRRVRQSR